MRMMIFFASLIYQESFSQVVSLPFTSGYPGLGTYSHHFIDAFSYKHNQASLSQVKKTVAGIYTERKFMLKEMQYLSAVVACPFQTGGASMNIDHFGYKNFNQSRVGVAYGRSLSRMVSLGVQFNYNRLNIPGYGAGSAVNFELAALFNLTETITAGVHLDNPVGGKFFRNYSEKVAAVYSMGVGLEASENCLISAEVLKLENDSPGINAGVQYSFTSRFFARAGLSTATNIYFAGIGLNWKSARIDFCSGWHQQSGLSPSIQLICTLDSKKAEAE